MKKLIVVMSYPPVRTDALEKAGYTVLVTGELGYAALADTILAFLQSNTELGTTTVFVGIGEHAHWATVLAYDFDVPVILFDLPTDGKAFEKPSHQSTITAMPQPFDSTTLLKVLDK